MTEPVPTAPIVVSFQGGALRVVGIERARQRASDKRREHVADQ
ncbi:hypothetical protein [Sorangium sp. So ce341]